MRLPQSSAEPLSIRLASAFTILVVWAAALPLCARAATEQLNCSPTSIDFGSVLVGQKQTEVIALTNSGTTSVRISAVSVSSSEFSVSGITWPVTLAAGRRTTLKVTFDPTKAGSMYGTVVVTSSASNPRLYLALAGTGSKFEWLKATPPSVSFGNVTVGTKATVPVVLTNVYSVSATLTAFADYGVGFSATGPALPVTLPPGASVTIHVSLAPPGPGATGGSVLIKGPYLNIPLTGTGTTIGELTISPATLKFGSVDVGKTEKEVATLCATGGNVTISSAKSNSEFEISGPSFPLTISAGHSVELDVVFAPKEGGVASGTLTLTSNASKKQTTESFDGTGILPRYSVELWWSPSTSSIVGYNVYRRTAAGSYSKINKALDPNTAYTDSTIVSGTTYYYAATAVNASGKESSYSKPLEVVVP